MPASGITRWLAEGCQSARPASPGIVSAWAEAGDLLFPPELPVLRG